ncbi:hypothetical protein [Enterovibrio coralii]|uniref:hypothetical protein n=1 Tax=Enterovibrio coralii TaxID=294935 RepID=UPI000AD376A3|nr:hypothetical protein [Enterovibrio coralii]
MLNQNENSRPPVSMAARLVGRILLVCTLLAFLVAGFALYLDYQARYEQTRENALLIQKTDLPAVAASVWQEDVEQLQVVTEGIFRNPDVAHVVVFEKDRILAEAGQTPSEPKLTYEWPIQYSQFGAEFELGYIRVDITLQHIYNSLTERFITLLLFLGAAPWYWVLWCSSLFT